MNNPAPAMASAAWAASQSGRPAVAIALTTIAPIAAK